MIKQKIILLILIVVSLSTKSQSYDILIDTNKLWSTVDDYLFSNTESYYTKFGDDTLVAGEVYKKILVSEDYYMLAWDLKGFAREDTNRRVYFRTLTGDEGLVYDFDVDIGDTVDFINPFLPIEYFDTTIIVINKTSVFFGDTIRTAIDIAKCNADTAAGYCVERWIEGVGSTIGVLENGYRIASVVGWYYRLICYYDNDLLIYQDSNYNKCYYNISIEEYDDNNSLKIFPNPVKDKFTIEFSSTHDNAEIQILQIDGKLIKTISIEKYEKQIVLDSKGIDNGIYYCILKVDGINTGQAKIAIIK